MAADDSSVEIKILVIDANSGAVIGKVVSNLKGIGAEMGPLIQRFDALGGKIDRLADVLDKAGPAGSGAGQKIGNGMREASGHTLNALDNVRLVRDDLGIRIPRAMEKVISQSKLAMGAIGALGGGLVALGGIEVLVNLGEQAYRFYQRISDVNVEMRKFAADAGKSANQELFSNSSIETTVMLLKQVNGQIAVLDKQRTEAGVGQDNSGSFMQYVNKGLLLAASQYVGDAALQNKLQQMSAGSPTYGTKDDRQRAELAENQAILDKRLELQKRQDEVNKREDALAHAGGTVEGRAATAAKQAAQKELNAAKDTALKANEQYLRATTMKSRRIEDEEGELPESQRTKVYEISPDAGDAERARADRNADLTARDANSKQSRTEMNEARHAKAEAGMAGEGTEQRFLDEKLEALRQLKERAAQVGMAGTAYNEIADSINKKFLGAQRKRIADENAQTAQIEAEAGTGGLGRLAKIDQERMAKLAEINRESSKFSDPSTNLRRTAAANAQAGAEGAKTELDYKERLAQLDAARADRFESESQRIQSAADRSAAEVMKAWRETYGGLNALDQRRVQSAQAVQDEVTKIQQDAAKQQGEVRQRIENETVKAERAGGRAGGANRQSEQTQAVLDEYRDRYDALEQLRAHDAANADLYRRQEIAAEQVKNGKLLDEQRAMRDRLAGQLQGLFSNPLEALKRQGEEMASKAAATYLMKIVKPAPGTMGTGGKGTLFGGIFGGAGGMLGLPGMEKYGGGRIGPGDNPQSHPGAGGPLTATPAASISAASSTLNTATATIHIGSATFTGMSAGMAGAGGGIRNAVYTTGGGNTGVFGGAAPSLSSSGDAGAASASSVGLASSSSSTGNAGSALPDNVQSVVGGVNQLKGMGTSVDQLGKALGAGSSITSKIPGAGALSKLAGNAKFAGAAGGAMGLFSAYEGSGGFGGALGGAVSGAQMGAMFGGPAGAAIGAIAGGVLGFIGFGARNKAARYDGMTVKPQIANDLRAFEAGTADYQSTYDDLEKLSTDAKVTTRGFGSGAKGYYNDHIVPEIKAAQQRLTRENKAERTQFGMTAAQFHTGGLISDFGDFGTSGREGFIHAMMGERVTNPIASSTHAQALDAINDGASHSQMAAYYGANAGTAQPQAAAPDVNLHFHSADAKGARDLFMAHKHHIRAALNDSYGENSGGYDYV